MNPNRTGKAETMRTLAIVMLFAASVTGCALKSDDPAAKNGVDGTVCVVNADCESPRVCLDGRCADLPAYCQATGTCGVTAAECQDAGGANASCPACSPLLSCPEPVCICPASPPPVVTCPEPVCNPPSCPEPVCNCPALPVPILTCPQSVCNCPAAPDCKPELSCPATPDCKPELSCPPAPACNCPAAPDCKPNLSCPPAPDCNPNLTCPKCPDLIIPECRDCACKGGVTGLTLTYNGAGGATVMVTSREGVLYGGHVDPGGSFSFTGLVGHSRKMGDDITIRTCKDTMTACADQIIATDCSEPISIGTVFGDYTVLDGSSRAKGKFCSPDPGGFGIGTGG